MCPLEVFDRSYRAILGLALKTIRLAKCYECTKTVESNERLPMFVRQPDKDYDKYYCGCHGWN